MYIISDISMKNILYVAEQICFAYVFVLCDMVFISKGKLSCRKQGRCKLQEDLTVQIIAVEKLFILILMFVEHVIIKLNVGYIKF